jgi:hypothetical protein
MPHRAGSMAEWLARYASLREGARDEAMAEFKARWGPAMYKLIEHPIDISFEVGLQLYY